MRYFPLFFNMEHKRILILGGNENAYKKVARLLPYDAEITVISEKIIEKIKKTNAVCIERSFCKSDLDVRPLFVIISEDEEKTKSIYSECKKMNIPVNSVDKPEFCDFIFPSVIRKNNISIGISSGGMSPTATICLKEKIESELPDNIDEIIDFMYRTRENISDDRSDIKLIMRELFLKMLNENKTPSKEETEKMIGNFGDKPNEQE